MTPKNLARLFVLFVALAGALGILAGKVPVAVVAVTVIIVNGAVVAWLKWHEEQHPANNH
ncbi:MAG TPA: hypothetical protein VL382_06190 [Terriglobales bacterium]|nr:hypothetical protein [Terriglobales bacterium]